MTFNRREKILIAGALAVLALLVGDRYALTPLLQRREEARSERLLRQAQYDEDKALLAQRAAINRKWQSMLDGGLKTGRAEAEGQILHCLGDWANAAGVRLSSLRPVDSTQQAELPEIVIHASGTGSMRAARKLLWEIQTAEVPVRVKMLQIGSRKDGTDDLLVHLRVSTLYRPEAQTPARPAKGATRTASRDRADGGEL